MLWSRGKYAPGADEFDTNETWMGHTQDNSFLYDNIQVYIFISIIYSFECMYIISQYIGLITSRRIIIIIIIIIKYLHAFQNGPKSMASSTNNS